jgi:selT/selW/selH-like putative selenoprotein
MRTTYYQVEELLKSVWPTVEIRGENYPAGAVPEALSSLASFSMLAGIVLAIFGEKPLQMLGIATPEWLKTVLGNKLYLFGGIFVFNQIGSSLTRTGAFEVYYDGDLIFSRLLTGRMPSHLDLVAA